MTRELSSSRRTRRPRSRSSAGAAAEFQKQIEPVIEKVAAVKGLQMVFSVADSGLVWADRGWI